jgi:hypothetical protein
MGARTTPHAFVFLGADFFCDINSPLARLRSVQRFWSHHLVCRCERFLTAPLRVPRPVSVAIAGLCVDRRGLTSGVTQRFRVRGSVSLAMLMAMRQALSRARCGVAIRRVVSGQHDCVRRAGAAHRARIRIFGIDRKQPSSRRASHDERS